MFADYKQRVLDAFELKKVNSTLSLNLLYPTRAKLRDECMEVIKSRFLEKDQPVITASFGQMTDMTSYLMKIRKTGGEKLKAFDNFLKDHTIDTDIKNIELLAWLIDFEPRPYRYEQDYTKPQVDQPCKLTPLTNSEPSPGEIEDETGPAITTGDTFPSPQPVLTITKPNDEKGTKKKHFPLRQVAKALITIALLTLGTYYILIKIQPVGYPPVTGKEKCMVWAGDHYQPVPCALKFDRQQVVALDSVQVKEFKKIMRPDTVTRNSIDKLWYFKTGSSLELFTAPGFHPVHTERKLKRLTEHMLFTYVHHD